MVLIEAILALIWFANSLNLCLIASIGMRLSVNEVIGVEEIVGAIVGPPPGAADAISGAKS